MNNPRALHTRWADTVLPGQKTVFLKDKGEGRRRRSTISRYLSDFQISSLAQVLKQHHQQLRSSWHEHGTEEQWKEFSNWIRWRRAANAPPGQESVSIFIFWLHLNDSQFLINCPWVDSIEPVDLSVTPLRMFFSSAPAANLDTVH